MPDEVTTEEKNQQTRIYEVGYLLMPQVPEENLAAEISKIRDVIESHGGSIITEEFPSLKTLAYTMEVRFDAKIQRYDEGYFGWIKFELQPPAVEQFQLDLKKNPSLIRFMCIATVREDTLLKKPIVGIRKPSREETDHGVISEEELDQTIEELVID